KGRSSQAIAGRGGTPARTRRRAPTEVGNHRPTTEAESGPASRSAHPRSAFPRRSSAGPSPKTAEPSGRENRSAARNRPATRSPKALGQPEGRRAFASAMAARQGHHAETGHRRGTPWASNSRSSRRAKGFGSPRPTQAASTPARSIPSPTQSAATDPLV